MAFSTAEIINIAFIPIYALLLVACLFSFFKHGKGKKTAFGLLFIFPLIRLVGNIILVVADQTSKKADPNPDTLKSLFTAGYILQLAGYGLLFSSALALTNRAILHDDKADRLTRGSRLDRRAALLSSPSHLLHLVNSVATILLIVGLSSSMSAFDTTSTSHKVDTTAQVGAILLTVITFLLLLMALYHLFIKGPVTDSARVILTFVAIACLPMLARIAWSTYRTTSGNLLNVNVWASLVLQYICETVAVSIFVALAFVLNARGGDRDLEEHKAVKGQALAAQPHPMRPYEQRPTVGQQGYLARSPEGEYKAQGDFGMPRGGYNAA